MGMFTFPFFILAALLAVTLLRVVLHNSRIAHTSATVLTSCENPLENLEVRIGTARVRNQLSITCELFVNNASKDAQTGDLDAVNHAAHVSLNSDAYNAEIRVLGEFQYQVPRNATAVVEVLNKSTNRLSLNTQRLVWTSPN